MEQSTDLRLRPLQATSGACALANMSANFIAHDEAENLAFTRLLFYEAVRPKSRDYVHLTVRFNGSITYFFPKKGLIISELRVMPKQRDGFQAILLILRQLGIVFTGWHANYDAAFIYAKEGRSRTRLFLRGLCI